MLRWAWTQLTSMRTALFLLLLLAVAAVPGSLFPQRPANPSIVTQYIKDHPDYGKLLDSLQLYDVYSSAWFSAIYILLFISLIGCVVPARHRALQGHALPAAAHPGPAVPAARVRHAGDPRRRRDPGVGRHHRRRRAAEEARLPRGRPGPRRRAAVPGGRARLPAGSRQPRLPHRADRRAGLRGGRRPVRLQRAADPGGGRHLREHPGRLRPVHPGHQLPEQPAPALLGPAGQVPTSPSTANPRASSASPSTSRPT